MWLIAEDYFVHIPQNLYLYRAKSSVNRRAEGRMTKGTYRMWINLWGCSVITRGLVSSPLVSTIKNEVIWKICSSDMIQNHLSPL